MSTERTRRLKWAAHFKEMKERDCLTISQIAEKVGMSSPSVANWLHARSVPSSDAFKLLKQMIPGLKHPKEFGVISRVFSDQRRVFYTIGIDEKAYIFIRKYAFRRGVSMAQGLKDILMKWEQVHGDE